MATYQQVQRFMDLQPLGVDGLPGAPLQFDPYPLIEPPQQRMTLRQRQQRQLQALTNQPVAPPTAQSYRQVMGADQFGNNRAGAVAASLRATRTGQPSAEMTQPELNQLRERGNVPPVMAPRQGNALGSNMVAGVDLNTSSVLGQRWGNDIRNEQARVPRAPITASNPGSITSNPNSRAARRTLGQTSFTGASPRIGRSNPGANPLNDFARGFPQR